MTVRQGSTVQVSRCWGGEVEEGATSYIVLMVLLVTSCLLKSRGILLPLTLWILVFQILIDLVVASYIHCMLSLTSRTMDSEATQLIVFRFRFPTRWGVNGINNCYQSMIIFSWLMITYTCRVFCCQTQKTINTRNIYGLYSKVHAN